MSTCIFYFSMYYTPSTPIKLDVLRCWADSTKLSKFDLTAPGLSRVIRMLRARPLRYCRTCMPHRNSSAFTFVSRALQPATPEQNKAVKSQQRPSKTKQ